MFILRIKSKRGKERGNEGKVGKKGGRGKNCKRGRRMKGKVEKRMGERVKKGGGGERDG